MIRAIKVTRYACACEHCQHKWEADSIPERCAACKRRTWNQPDKRFKAKE